jgi:hypothetical protein
VGGAGGRAGGWRAWKRPLFPTSTISGRPWLLIAPVCASFQPHNALGAEPVEGWQCLGRSDGGWRV